MSNELDYVEIHDKRLMVVNRREYGVMKSAVDIMYQNYNSSSFSSSSYNVTVNVPSETVLYNRLYQTVTWRLEMSGNATVSPNLLPVDVNGNLTYAGFRAFALDNATKNVQVQLQNQNY